MPGMNWAMPWAPAGETANGLKFDSAISCAASSAAETFHGRPRAAAARGSGPGRRRAGRRRRRARRRRSRRRRADRVAGRRAGRRAGVESVVPGLPGVALDEAEAAGVGGQPAVGGLRARGRARWRSGAASGPAARPSVGSGWAAKSAACSASERKPELTTSVSPARGGRRGHAVEGRGDVGAHPLAVAVDERARSSRRRSPIAGIAPPEPAGARRLRRPPTATTGRARRPRASSSPSTVALARTGAKETRVREGDPQAAGPTPFARAAARAATRARARGRQACSMWAGLGRPFGSVGGESRRGRSSRIERAAEIAARSAARCTRALPGHRSGDRDQRQGAGDQHEAAAERQRQRLAVLPSATSRAQRRPA